MRWIAKLLLYALAMLAISSLLPGITVENFYIAVIASLALGVINLFVRPILFILTLPLTIVTLGLFSFVLNALMLWFVGSIIAGFVVEGFVSALIGAVIMSFIVWIGEKFIKAID